MYADDLTVNMRFAIDTCAFDFPQANNQTISNLCQDSCAKLSTSLETNIQNPSNSTPYDYCQNANFVPNIDGCASCYSAHPDQAYLSNCKIAIDLESFYTNAGYQSSRP